MREDLPAPDPERLALDPELGPLLEQANAESASGFDEATAFQRLAERLTPPVKLRRWQRQGASWGAPLAAAGFALAVAVLFRFEPSSDGIVVGPEASAGAAGTVSAPQEQERAAAEKVATPRAAVLTAPERNSVPARARSERREKARSASRAATARPEPAAAPPAEPGEPGAQEDCLALARHGQSQQAERCFGARAAGSGLGAEMALYEMARLRRDVLRDAAGALAVLGEYRQRFQRGSLRNEVDLSRVELLALLGRGAEALQESAALLDSATGRERAAELHLLRGNVYRHDLGDLQAAASEYAQVEAQGGARGAEAAALRAACLEALKEREMTP